jgi:hypothetical protein
MGSDGKVHELERLKRSERSGRSDDVSRDTKVSYRFVVEG